MPGAPVAQSTQLNASDKCAMKADELKAGAGDGGSFDDSNDDDLIMSSRTTLTGKSPCKRSAARDDTSGSKLAKLVEEGGGTEKGSLDGVEFEPEELASGFLAEPREEAEVELEVNSKDLFKGWDELESELDEPHSGEELKSNRINFTEKELYGGDDAAKGDMYQGIEPEGDEDTDDEDLYYSKNNVGSVHEVEEDIELEELLAEQARCSKNLVSQVSLPDGQSQLINIEGGPRTQGASGGLGGHVGGRDNIGNNAKSGVGKGASGSNEEGYQGRDEGHAEDDAVRADVANAGNGGGALEAAAGGVGVAPADEDDDANAGNGDGAVEADVGGDGAAPADEVDEPVVEDPRQNLYQVRNKASTYVKNQEISRKM